MKIINKTNWNAKDIARLIRRVAQDELDPGKLKHARVTLKYQRGNYGRLGDCHYGTMLSPYVRMRLFLPRNGPIDEVKLAQVIAHELGHAKGIRHRDMNNTRYGWVHGWRDVYAYAADFSIGRITEKPKPTKIDAFQKKHAKALAMACKWKSRLKRTTTTLKKWEKQVRYYENRKAACSNQTSHQCPESPSDNHQAETV